GCSTVDNHEEDVIWGNIKSKNGRNCDAENDAYKVFDETLSIKFFGQYGSVRDVPFASKVGWNELCAVSMFIWGLQPEMAKNVRIFEPKTLYNAYLLANMQEATNKLLGKSYSKNVDSNSMILDVSDCLKSDSIKIITNKEKNDVERDIGKKEDSNFCISANNSEISVIDDSGKMEQKRKIGYGIEDHEVIELNDDIGLMGFDEACNENVNVIKIECTTLPALEDICEENVESADMELDDNNGLVVIDKVCNKVGKGNDLKSDESQ
ncbi:hypothetical protein Tco_1569147, partial [Tanacetum coccineum]